MTAAFLCGAGAYLVLSVFFFFAALAPAPIFAAGAPASLTGPFTLKAPKEVAAGKDFVLTLSTADSFPLLVGDEATFFESCDDGKPQLIGIRTLDAQGVACMQIQKKKAGACHYSALVGPFQSETEVMIVPGPPAAIREIQERLFLETGRHAAAEFSIWDDHENKITAGSAPGKQIGKLLTVSITDPGQNLLPEKDFKITSNPAGNFVVSFAAGEVGNYLVEARLPAHPPHDTDICAHSLVCAREPGAVVGIDLEIENGREPFLRINKDRLHPGRLILKTSLQGENNINKMISPAEERNILFSTDRPALLRIDGLAGGEAVLTERGKGGPATVTVSYLGEGKGLQKTIPLWIAGEPAQIKLETKIDDLTAQVQAALLDKEGLLTWEKTKVYRLNLPEGLKATTQTDFNHGRAEFVLKAEDYGSYTVGIIAGEGLRRNLKIDFAEKIQPARHAVIFIGQKTYIKDGRPAEAGPAPEMFQGRVFVPAEFLTIVFGVEVRTFSGTKKIALQSPDGTEITIDREAGQLTVTDAKKETTTTTPAGTFILQEKNGTYFIPAGIIARLLDYEVDYLPKRNQIEHVTFKKRLPLP